MRRKKLVNPGVKYPKSKLVREALIPKRKREHTYTTCACGNVDYKTLVYLAKNSIRVIDNLAKTLASMEEKFDETKKNAVKMIKKVKIMRGLNLLIFNVLTSVGDKTLYFFLK